MHVGVVGLRGAGAHIVRRLLAGGHQCVVFDTSPRLVAELAAERAFGVVSLKGVTHELDAPRLIILSPADSQGAAIAELLPYLESGDIIAAFGSTGSPGEHARRADALAAAHVRYVTVASDHGFDGPWPCHLAVDGEDSALHEVEPVLADIAPTVRRRGPGSAIEPNSP